MEFEPKILGFLCNWCSYAGADLAGVSRVQYPPNIRIIRVMCSGRIDPLFIFEALKIGIDGVIITGCHIGDCHYLTGNNEAEMKYDTIKKLLNFIGLAERVHLEWVSASEGVRFGKVVSEFTDKIKNLGKMPLNPDILLDLDAMQNATQDTRSRALIGGKRRVTGEGNVYDKKISVAEFEKMQETALFDEFIRHKMLLLLEKEPLSVKLLAKKTNIDTSKILEHIVVLRGNGLIAMDKIDALTPYYVSVGGI